MIRYEDHLIRGAEIPTPSPGLIVLILTGETETTESSSTQALRSNG